MESNLPLGGSIQYAITSLNDLTEISLVVTLVTMD